MKKYLLFLWLALLTVQMRSQTVSVELTDGQAKTFEDAVSLQFIEANYDVITYNKVYIEFKDNTLVAFSLADDPTVTFGVENLTISTTGTTNTYVINDVSKFYFVLESMDKKDISINAIPTIKFVGDNICINGLAPGGVVQAFSFDGKLLLSTKANSEGYVEVDTSAKSVILKSASFTLKLTGK